MQAFHLTVAAMNLICAAVGLSYVLPLESTEFGGGSVTGVLCRLHFLAISGSVACAALCFFKRRGCATCSFIAALCFAPLYVYGVFPKFFQILIPGVYTAALDSWFAWDGQAICGLVLSAATVGISVVFPITPQSKPEPETTDPE